MKKFLNWLKGPSSDFILFIVLLVLINIAGQKAFVRFDLTEPKSYSISKASANLVKNLDEPLSIRVFFDKNLPAPYNSVAQYVEDFLEEYKSAANKNFSVTFMDISKEENLALARDFGLHQVQIQEVKNNEVGLKQAYMGLVISYGASVELIDPISSTDGFEYKLTSTISKMISTTDSLASLPKGQKIKITVYLTNTLKNLRISGMDQVEKLVENAYKEVNNQKQDRLDFQVIHPAASDAVALIERYGIQGLTYNSGNGVKETGVFGVVIESGDNFRVLPVQVQQSIFGFAVAGLDELVDSINENIQSLVSKPTQVGYITGHNELPLTEEKYAQNFEKIISGMYELVELNLSEDKIPANMSSIIINGPQFDFEEKELYEIDQFIMRGGNVMFLIDGMNTMGAAAYYNSGTPQYQKNEINLDRLLEKYGVKRGLNFVMDQNCYTQANQQYGKLNYYWAPILQKKNLAKNHPITKNLGYVIMLQNSSLDVSEAVLATTSDKAWTIDKEDIMLNPLMITDPNDPARYKKENLAVLLEGKFESAFDEAPIIEEDEDEEDEDEESTEPKPVKKPVENESDITTSNHLKKSKIPGKIFVVGTSYITTYQVLDATASSPIAMFLLNAVDYLNGNEDFCTMRTKGLSLNTLTVKSAAFAKIMQYFNQFGLVVLVAVCGLVILKKRNARRKQIDEKYNPDDERRIK